jgi:hypothetical protein
MAPNEKIFFSYYASYLISVRILMLGALSFVNLSKELTTLEKFLKRRKLIFYGNEINYYYLFFYLLVTLLITVIICSPKQGAIRIKAK